MGVLARGGDLLVLDVLLQDQVAPLVVGVGGDAVPSVGDGHDTVHGVKAERRRLGAALCIIFYACFLALIIELSR